jgi:hypothetical protein
LGAPDPLSRITFRSYAELLPSTCLGHPLLLNSFGHLREVTQIGGREPAAACALALCQSPSGAEHVFKGETDVIVQLFNLINVFLLSSSSNRPCDCPGIQWG